MVITPIIRRTDLQEKECSGKSIDLGGRSDGQLPVESNFLERLNAS